MTRDDLAVELYVVWSAQSSPRDQSLARWRVMPDFGRRPFFELADEAIKMASAASDQCECGAPRAIGPRCMACASREAE